ncbi:hypothetical protein ACW9HJ_09675 [Nocardia gipuzkoensis]
MLDPKTTAPPTNPAQLLSFAHICKLTPHQQQQLLALWNTRPTTATKRTQPATDPAGADAAQAGALPLGQDAAGLHSEAGWAAGVVTGGLAAPILWRLLAYASRADYHALRRWPLLLMAHGVAVLTAVSITLIDTGFTTTPALLTSQIIVGIGAAVLLGRTLDRHATAPADPAQPASIPPRPGPADAEDQPQPPRTEP